MASPRSRESSQANGESKYTGGMPTDWAPDERGVYHLLISWSTTDAPWLTYCDVVLPRPPDDAEPIESATSPATNPSQLCRRCSSAATALGGIGGRDVMRMIDELEARGELPAAVIVKPLYSGPMHVIDDHPIGPITITEPTRVQGWVRGSVTVPQGQSLSVSGTIAGDVTVDGGGTFDLGGTVRDNVIIRGGAAARINGTVSGSVLVEDGADVEIHGMVRGMVTDPEGVVRIAETARIGNQRRRL
jgi:hypothetical protein